MRKLRLFEHSSLDGVIQHSADNGDFPDGDWTTPYRTPAGRDELFAENGGHFDLLLGRRTYDMWSGFWPKAPRSPMADALNAATKYVARALLRYSTSTSVSNVMQHSVSWRSLRSTAQRVFDSSTNEADRVI